MAFCSVFLMFICFYLQAPLYPTDSDDRPEKPLSWEPMDDMEFDDEFSLPQSTILATLIARRSEEETYSNKHPKLVILVESRSVELNHTD